MELVPKEDGGGKGEALPISLILPKRERGEPEEREGRFICTMLYSQGAAE